MFTDVLDTTTRTNVATFFAASQPRAFHPEEVRKATRHTGSTVATTLRYLAKNGYLTPIKRNGEVFYRINFRYPYIEEIKNFLLKNRSKSSDPRDMVWRELEKIKKANLILLTGLFTNQLHVPTDIVIVGDVNKSSLVRTIEKIEKEMRQEINYTHFSDEEFEKRVNMFEKFTRDLFDYPHLIVLDKRKRKAEPGKSSKNSKSSTNKKK